jgi:phosphoglycolate phosphatase-like HAD superfamily hydrolase
VDDILSDVGDRVRLVIERHEEEAVAEWRALADDLYAAMDECFDAKGRFIYEEDTAMPRVVEAMARYREATK